MTYYALYQKLFAHYGPQHWWPAKSRFEVMVGAVLTQNTAWSNVERAIAHLKRARLLSAQAILAASPDVLAECLRPSGYFNVKAARIRSFCEWFLAQGGYRRLRHRDTPSLRQALLGVHGVGAETADDILLYAFNRPVFVVDAYTKRLLARLGLLNGSEGYETVRHTLERALARRPDRVALFNEYHALVVIHGKNHCRARPVCADCPLQKECLFDDSVR